MINCEKCNKGTLELIDTLGSIETWRCNQCGYEEIAHVHRTIKPRLSSPVFRVVGLWLSTPSKEVIIKAQEEFPELKELSKVTLYQKALKHEPFELGYFSEDNINKQRSLLNSLGIKIEVIAL